MKSSFKSTSSTGMADYRESGVPGKAASVVNSFDISGSFMSVSDSSNISDIGNLFSSCSIAGLAIYATLLFLVFRFAPVESFEEPEGVEKNAHVLSLILLFVTNGSRFVPLVLTEDSFDFVKTGFWMGTLTIQVIAISANILMAFFPTPVMIDPITGLRVLLVRWAEWTALAFIMTFMTENIDVSLRHSKVTYNKAIAIALSTSAGLIFPFCTDFKSWCANMFASCFLFTAVYQLLYERYMNYHYGIQTKQAAKTADQEEHHELLRVSYVLSVVCSVTWTSLTIFYIAACVFRIYDPEGIFASSKLNSIGMCIFEVASKIWYFSVLIDAHKEVFDEKARVVRRLEELRSFMSAVWDSSSDVIVFCGQKNDRVSARVSPAFLKMIGVSSTRLAFLDRGDVSLVLEVDLKQNEYSVFAFDLSRPVNRGDVESIRGSFAKNRRRLNDVEGLEASEKNVALMAQLVSKACSAGGDEDISIMTEFVKVDGNGEEAVTPCEAKVAKIDGGSSVLVLRDITDRIQRFEAEKKLVEEITTRQKDAETNKFSRHEIKNGILSAIALLDHIREGVDRREEQEHPRGPDNEWAAEGGGEESDGESSGSNDTGMKESFSELESTLRDILDTILDQAMAREIVYGEYKPRNERMKVLEVLSSLRRRSSPRFPMRVNPDPLPELGLDRHLLRYIYRNAVSNACKYGHFEGIVETHLFYSPESKTFTMEVVNAPGDGHEELTKLSPDIIETVFSPGTQLRATRIVAGKAAQLVRNESSGNGAWIMQKCAEALGGKCSISFESKRTVFTFSCPVIANVAPDSRPTLSLEKEFCLPVNTWGIVVDDSNVQRKLMDRFLSMAGIQDSRRRIYGRDAAEVYGMCDIVADLMAAHPKDKFILIADENLDIEDGGARHRTVSGSLCVEKLRQQLDRDTESRLLALIRSANDSMSDIELYKSRAHGYLLKEPMQKGKVLEMLRPWWVERFSKVEHGAAPLIQAVGEENCGTSAEDIRESLDTIDALVSVADERILSKRWRTIREKLHTLKGDLKTMESEKSMSDLFDRMDRLMNNKDLPDFCLDQWELVKNEVESVL